MPMQNETNTFRPDACTSEAAQRLVFGEASRQSGTRFTNTNLGNNYSSGYIVYVSGSNTDDGLFGNIKASNPAISCNDYKITTLLARASFIGKRDLYNAIYTSKLLDYSSDHDSDTSPVVAGNVNIRHMDHENAWFNEYFWAQKNTRRFYLIEKKLRGLLSDAETTELEELQQEACIRADAALPDFDNFLDQFE